MPEMSYDNVDSPFFREDSGKEDTKGAEGNGSSEPAATDSGESTGSGTAQGTAESGKTESGKTESKKTESAETERLPVNLPQSRRRRTRLLRNTRS